MAKRKKSKALDWILKEAKRLRHNYPNRFDTWREYVSQASAIYSQKHHGKSPVGRKRKKVGATKFIDKGETKHSKVTKTFLRKRNKSGHFQGYKKISGIGNVKPSLQKLLRKKASQFLRVAGYSQLSKDVLKDNVPVSAVINTVDKAMDELMRKVNTGNYSKRLIEKAKRANSMWQTSKMIFS